MRKCLHISFAYMTFGTLLFAMGLFITYCSDVSYGYSCPDVLRYLTSEVENDSVLTLDRFGESENSLNVFAELSNVESTLSKESEPNFDETLDSSSDLIEEPSYKDFLIDKSNDDETLLEPLDEESTNVLSSEENVLIEIELSNDSIENDNLKENELDFPVYQEELDYIDLNKAYYEATDDINSEGISDKGSAGLYDSVQDVQEESSSTEKVDSIIEIDESDTIALPIEIAETIKEANALYGENEEVVFQTDLLEEEQEPSNENVVESNELTFNNPEKLTSDDASDEDSLNPDALEIEEINKEYGWNTVESNFDATTTKSSVGFEVKPQPQIVDTRRFNKSYGAQVDVVLSNEFWIVGNNGFDYYFWKFENNTWRRLTSDDFFSTDDPGRTTIVWAHGYQTDMVDATQRASVLHALIERGQRNTNSSKPYRLVVWKWDSERNMARIRVDAKNKTALANCSGVSLGKFIGRFNPSDDVCLIGFSFGAQVVGSALQYIATYPNAYQQNVTGRESKEGFATSGKLTSKKSGSVSLMLISAACDSGVFEIGGAYSSGATIPAKVLNVFNPYDFALHYYPFVSNVRSDSLGVHAVTSEVFPNAKGRVNNFNVSETVGRKHSFIDEISTVPTETLMNFFFGD